MRFIVVCLELLDQGEDVAVILAQELSETLDVLCMDLPLRDHAPGICEVFIDLVVQLSAVGYDNEPPTTGYLSQYLLGEEDHGDTLA